MWSNIDIFMLEAPKICKYIQNVKFIKLKLEKQSRNDLKIRQITKISKLLLFFPSCKMIQNHHFCWSSSLHNQMLHITGQKQYNWDHQKWHFNVFIGQNFWDSHFWTRCTIKIMKWQPLSLKGAGIQNSWRSMTHFIFHF